MGSGFSIGDIYNKCSVRESKEQDKEILNYSIPDYKISNSSY